VAVRLVAGHSRLCSVTQPHILACPVTEGSEHPAAEPTKPPASQIRARLRWPKFLTPDRPSEVAALVSVVAIVAGAIGYGLRVVLPASTPWHDRVDKICLNAGDDFVNIGGNPVHKLGGEIQVMRRELTQLDSVSVPTEYVLTYNTILGDKKEEVDLLGKELALAKLGRPPRYAEKLLGTRQVYATAAQQLPLNVCGQGTGHG
jgi:hypothetical protein